MKKICALVIAGVVQWAGFHTVEAIAAPVPTPTNDVPLRLQLLAATPSVDPLRGEAHLLAFRLMGSSGVGFTRLEIAANVGGSNVWKNLATLAGESLRHAADRHLFTLPSNSAPQRAFFRVFEHTETVVSHAATGRLPFLLSNVSYGVDEGRSFDLDYTRGRIQSAADLARSNNIPFASPPTETPLFGRLTKFHFWPNILDLTEIRFLDEPLYNRIVTEILENDPARMAITADWKARVQRGERMYLARDFVSVLEAGGIGFGDVHYAFVINLDAKCAQELQVHEYAEQGLARLHDGLIDTLNERFSHAVALPFGEVWHLCLRGNLRRSRSQAIIVDKLASVPVEGFFVARLYATCASGGGGSPPTGGPPPEEEPPPIPEPPPEGGSGGDGSNGERAESKIPGAAKPPDRGDGEPPVRPWPGGEKEYEPPGQGTQSPASGGSGSPNLSNEQQKIQQLLDQARQMADGMRAKIEQDLDAFRGMSFEWKNGVHFNDPCLQEIYDRYAAQIAPLQQQIGEHQAAAGQSIAGFEDMRRTASGPVRALLSKQGLWDNMITVGGPWSNVRVPCLPPFIPKSGVSISGIVITEEGTKAFHDDLYRAMVNGKSWDEAVAAAIADPKRYPAGVPYGDKLYQAIWTALAQCYRDLFTAMFRIYLESVFPAMTSEQREEMIPVLFDCDKPLTAAQRAEWQGLLTKFKDAEAATLAELYAIHELENQIKDLLHQFRLEAKACLDRAIAGLHELETIGRVLAAALVEARTPGAPGSLPMMGANFCDTLRKMLTFPPVQNCPGLKAYIMMLLEANCPH